MTFSMDEKFSEGAWGVGRKVKCLETVTRKSFNAEKELM
jgi:hypothetical protein